MDISVRRCEKIDWSDCRRSRSKLNKSLSEIIRYDLKILELVEDMTLDKRLYTGLKLKLLTLDSLLLTPSLWIERSWKFVIDMCIRESFPCIALVLEPVSIWFVMRVWNTRHSIVM